LEKVHVDATGNFIRGYKKNGSVKRQCNVQKQKGDDILNL
jgi:hypothetical protein